jgi:ureidoacrylate peracid hydrolase
MHKISISQEVIDKVIRRTGRRHPFDVLDPRKTALVVIDMQYHFMAEGFMAETPVARAIVPNVNRLAAALRDMGGHVVWIQNVTNDTRESWSTFHEFLMTPDRAAKRYASMEDGAQGHALWPDLDVRPQDTRMNKRRYSAFIQGSSDLERHLRARGIDSIIVVGVATQVCCESTARDASMLNFKTLMISDACATDNDTLHNASLDAFYQNFGDVQSVDEVLASLQRGQGKATAEKSVA